jgi:transposase-like protein
MFMRGRSWFGRRMQRSTMFCPVCRGEKIELTNQVYGREDNWKKEIYVCHDCDSSWDWTFEQPFFRWPKRVKSPGWVKID